MNMHMHVPHFHLESVRAKSAVCNTAGRNGMLSMHTDYIKLQGERQREGEAKGGCNL